MIQGWGPVARRRRRRPLLALGIVVVFLAAAAAGAAVSLQGRGLEPVRAASASLAATSSPLPSGAPPASDGLAGGPDLVASPSANATPAPPSASASLAPSPSAAPSVSPSPNASPSGSTAGPSLGPAAGAAVDRALAAKLQRALETIRRKLGTPGIQATVVFPDGRTWTGVAGSAVVRTKTPVTAATPFVFASVTKTFTAALICRLADKGKLHLDDRLSSWLPEIPGAKGITLRQLLDHQSGLADFFDNMTLNRALQRNHTRTWTPQEIIKYIPPRWFPPGGANWGYSNTNYLLLGLVAEKAGGAPWATQVHREFLDPLGLSSVYVQGVDNPTGRIAHAYQVYVGGGGKLGYHDFADGTGIIPFSSVTTATFSAGSLAGTSSDLARWGALLYSGKVLSPHMTAEMLKFQKAMNRTPSLSYGATVYYGLGVSRMKRLGRFTVVGHTGALDGTRASIRWLPKQHVAIAAFFNRDGFYLTGDLVADALLPVLFPKPPASPSPSAYP